MRRVASLGAVALLAGCAAVQSPFSPPEVPALGAYRTRVATELAAADGAATMAERNATIDGYLLLADAAYRRYEAGLYLQVATLETVADIAVLGLSVGGALASGEAAKRAAAAAAALGGSKAIVSADFYEQQAKTPIVATMRRLRAEKRTAIEEGKRRPVRAYSLATAMLDVADYAAVDVVSAIEALTQTSTRELRAEEERLDAVRAEPPEVE